MQKSALKRTSKALSVEQMKELIAYAKSQHVAELKVDDMAFRFSPTAFLMPEMPSTSVPVDQINKKQLEDFNNLLFMSAR